jgi:ferric iron reductase protein FhuF
MPNNGHPLMESLRCAEELGPEYDMPVRDPEQDGWINALSLFQDDDQRLQGIVATLGKEYPGTEDRHLAASGFIIAYLTRLVYPLITQYVVENRVIDVSLRNLEFHTKGQGFDATALGQPKFACLPDDPDASHPDAEIVPDAAALYAKLKEQLFDANFGLVIPALCRSAKASEKVSWNAVAASCAQVFYWLHNLTDDKESVMRHAEAFFTDESSPMYQQLKMELFEHEGKQGYIARRAGCCLFWKVREGDLYCSGCVILSEEEQDTRLRNLLASTQ